METYAVYDKKKARRLAHCIQEHLNNVQSESLTNANTWGQKAYTCLKVPNDSCRLVQGRRSVWLSVF